MDTLLFENEQLARDDAIAYEVINHLRFTLLEELAKLNETARERLEGVSFYDTSSRISGYQQALLDIMDVIKEKATMTGYDDGKI